MRFKEIKSGMAVNCKNDTELTELLKEAERLGYVWHKTNRKPTNRPADCGRTIHFYNSGGRKNIAWSYIKEGGTEFSDLILPELTAEEAIKIRTEMCRKSSCTLCPISLRNNGEGKDCDTFSVEHTEKVVEILAQWKADHEKKEPEIETEWFWQGRIFRIHEDGCYYQIKDGTGFYDTGCEYRESAEEYMKDELKEYCKTHEGEFIATVEHICRVKAVE